MITAYEPLCRRLVTIPQDHRTPEYPGRSMVNRVPRIEPIAKPRKKYDPREEPRRRLDIFA